ncbi:Do family serine endopeptidase [Enterovirga rhinocerotis]|uniref:Do/DeqQ family serine protease n=1 Tax=Enterovirga rhinocerotis TaxID=1339210 RepID=A0A4R7CAQ9_9HYPH|nr:Do family serine endopeptidase [Enterovirga rhinocerotis]TDR94465.1 Do/DeqQ family serine protease [Enterovirga rhinocerotis]
MRPTLHGPVGLALAACLLASVPASSQTLRDGRAAEPQRTVPTGQPQVQLSFAPVVRNAVGSVVNVYGARVEKNPRMAQMDEFFRRFFGERGPSMAPERTQRSLGSGVIVDSSGLVVTNNHVIASMTEVKVALHDRREVEAEILLRDPRTDLAVLRLKGKGTYRAIDLGDPDELQVGDLVLAIGNPFGVGQTVTQGIVSGLARTNIGVSDYGYFIQTDASINPGNSGGALVDMAGRLVGINSAIYSQSGGSVGIGFAIPSNMVRAVVASAKAGAKAMQRPYLGATLQKVSADLAEGLGIDPPTGALVASVRSGGPAEQAGLRTGDVILEVDGRIVDDPDAFGWRFALKGVTGETPVKVNRRGKSEVLTIKLGPPPEVPARDPISPRGRTPFTGMTLVNLSPAVSDEMHLDLQEGVVVSEVEDGTTAERLGFRKGDVIVAINGDRIRTTRELDRIVRDGARGWEVSIRRAGQVLTSVFGG